MTLTAWFGGHWFGYLLDVNDLVYKTLYRIVTRFGRLNIIINNVGYGLIGAVEETTMQESRIQMKTIFWCTFSNAVSYTAPAKIGRW